MRSTSTRTRLARESWGRFADFVPEMGRPGFAAAWLTAVGAGAAGLVAVGAVLAQAVPYGALAWQVVLTVALAVVAYGGFWRNRLVYRRRLADAAYRALFFRFVGPSVVLIAATAWMPVVGASGPGIPRPAALALLIYLLGTAALIAGRGRELFWNIDLRAFVYSVFPDRGTWVESPLFEQLRHPIYSAAVRSVVAVALVRNNAEALACAAVVGLAFRLWAAVEDHEMMERYPAYGDYRLRVPAIAVGPTRWAGFARFLLLGPEKAPLPEIHRPKVTPAIDPARTG